ncbi:zinc-binding dehydrogenase, partial [Pseudomonas syringae group genomosp. 7]|uniref:zinc-binding dehydrogenase n=1 Tax=Pseudomonas syringae group genomosp. 7 TaxID=251699 RepID=UPI00376F661A
RIQLMGSTLRSRDDTFKADMITDLGQHVWPLFTEGSLKPQLAKSFEIKDAEAAVEELATKKLSGKIVLVIDERLV